MFQIREEVSFTKGRIIVRGKLITRGQAKRADYILYCKANIPLALIEAKDAALVIEAAEALPGSVFGDEAAHCADQTPPSIANRERQMSATTHKDFRIDPFQTTSGGWRAKITRLDGQKIKVAVPARDEHDSITTGGMESLSAEAAIDEAKRLIDGGGMS